MAIRVHPLFSGRGLPAGLTLDDALICRLEADFRRLATDPDRFVRRFYQLFFERRPEIRRMFPEDMAAQRRKLLHTLEMVVSNLRKPEETRKRLADLGVRHAGLGVKPEHYPVLVRSMVDAMGAVRGDEFTDELRQDWTVAISLIADAVRAAQERAEQDGK